MIFGKKFALFAMLMIPVATGFSTIAHAQFGGLEMYPQLQQNQQSASQQQGNMNVPSITEEGGMSTGIELPEFTQPEFNTMNEILLDRKVDPEQYIVGPGDYLSVYLWGEIDQQYSSRVTPEGNIIIPAVGAVMVSDMTLAEAGRRIRSAVGNSYTGIDITISLIMPRRFRLFVTGVVEHPNMYAANALTRVSDLFIELDTALFPETTEAVLGQQQQQGTVTPAQQQRFTDLDYPADFIEGIKAGLRKRSDDISRSEKKASSKRAITIYRSDEQIPVDLLRFERLGDIDANPYVNGGDRVFVSGYLGDIFVEGEVISPGIYEFKSGDTVSDLIGFGGGLTAVADSTATLVRFGSDGREQMNIVIDLHDALAHPENPEYLLQESDRLFIRARYDYKELANVRVQGEVHFPGYYPITENVTRLTDIIAMAGGFTDEANLGEAQIIKRASSATDNPEYQRLRLMPVEEMTDDEYEFFKNMSRTRQNAVTIDFVKLFNEADPDLSQDIILEEGDNVIIPPQREMVRVIGAVQVPGYIRVEPGADYLYYIDKAGGYNWNAKSGDVRIVKAKTGQQFKPGRNVVIEGGDTINVPEKRPVNYWQFFQDTMQVFANVATVVLIIQNVINQ